MIKSIPVCIQYLKNSNLRIILNNSTSNEIYIRYKKGLERGQESINNSKNYLKIELN